METSIGNLTAGRTDSRSIQNSVAAAPVHSLGQRMTKSWGKRRITCRVRCLDHGLQHYLAHMIFARFAPIVFECGLVLVAWAALAVRPHVWDDRHSPVCTTDGLSTNKCEIAQLNPGISQLVPHLRDNGRQPRAVCLDGSVGHLRQTNGGSLRQHSAETTDGPPRAVGHRYLLVHIAVSVLLGDCGVRFATAAAL